jgi:hypothetical protein
MSDWTCERTRTAATSAHDVLITTRALAAAPTLVGRGRPGHMTAARGEVTP